MLPVIVLSRIVSEALEAYTPPPLAFEPSGMLCAALSRTTVPAHQHAAFADHDPAALGRTYSATRPPLIVSPEMRASAVPASVKIRKSGASVAATLRRGRRRRVRVIDTSEMTSGSALCSLDRPGDGLRAT